MKRISEKQRWSDVRKRHQRLKEHMETLREAIEREDEIVTGSTIGLMEKLARRARLEFRREGEEDSGP